MQRVLPPPAPRYRHISTTPIRSLRVAESARGWLRAVEGLEEPVRGTAVPDLVTAHAHLMCCLYVRNF